MPTFLHVLFAELQLSPGPWTGKEIIVTLAGVGTLAGSVWTIARALNRAARRSERQAQEELRQQKEKTENAERDCERARQRNAHWKRKLIEMEAERDRKQAELELANGKLQAAEEELHHSAQSHTQLHLLEERIRQATARDGHLWKERLLPDATPFQSLDGDGRRCPIISLLNLKGGVGKTTLTANLARAFRRIGVRTLLLDLDLQGSLTSFFVAPDRLAQLDRDNRLLDTFLNESYRGNFTNLLEYSETIGGDEGLMVAPTIDRLAYAETNLTVRWFFRGEGGLDPRLLLRRELQSQRIAQRFDVVLIDCPPVMNMCCVNALAASDYVLIPVMPSKQTRDRAQVTVRKLREFRERLNPHIQVLGVVPVRTFGAKLTALEGSNLDGLQRLLKNLWTAPITRFSSHIRQLNEIRDSEEEGRTLQEGDVLLEEFVRLAEEIKSRLPTFCMTGEAGGLQSSAEVRAATAPAAVRRTSR